MLTVSELARMSGTTPDTVRYYTRMGLLNPGRHKNNGYRLYHKADAGRLRFISQAKKLGFTLAEIQEITGHAEHGQSPCPMVREILQRRIAENRLALESLIRLQERMESALRLWEEMPDGVPDGHSVCYLIESFSREDEA